MNSKRIAVLGSTGNIGKQTVEVIARAGHLRPCVIAGRRNRSLLAEQARVEGVEFVAVPGDAPELREALPPGVALLSGEGSLAEAVRRARPDMVVCAVVGSAGLRSSLVAVEHGIPLATANKESLVCGGGIIMPAARRTGATVLPIDSEHSGIFQCLTAGTPEEIHRVYITSSGGALRDFDDRRAASATVDEVLNHPTWNMGKKVTVDSATLMNKALEIIEAHWLFGLPADKMAVLIHAQSIVHAIIEFRDGSQVAQLGRPDMRMPIAYALNYPDRPATPLERLDLASAARLDFRRPAGRELKPLALAAEVVNRGGGGGAVLSAANEVAVGAFLEGRIRFGDIVPAVAATLEEWYAGENAQASFADGEMTIESVLSADGWGRNTAGRLLDQLER